MNCPQCIFRTEKTTLRSGKIEFLAEAIMPVITNKKDFCRLGYAQNPKTIKAKNNALKNKACLCDNIKGTSDKERWPLIEFALAHANNLNKALSALPFKIHVRDYL